MLARSDAPTVNSVDVIVFVLDNGTATITNNNTASLQVINSNTTNASSSAIYASARSGTGAGSFAIGVYGTSIAGQTGYGGYFIANGNGNANRTYVGVYGSSVVASSNSTQVGGSFRVEGGYTSGSVTGVLSTVDTIIEGGTNHLYRGVLGTTTNFYVDTTGSGYFANNILIGTTSSLGYKLNVSGSSNFTGNVLITGSVNIDGGLFDTVSTGSIPTGSTLIYTINTGSYQAAIKVEELSLESHKHYVADQSMPWRMYDLLSIACWNLGKKGSAKKYARKAVELNPDDERLAKNYEFIMTQTAKDYKNGL